MLLVVVAGCMLLMAVGAQAATVTVGSPLKGLFLSTSYGSATLTNSALPESGARVTSPVDGTIVRWRIIKAIGGPFKLRVLTPVSGSTYTGAASSSAQTAHDTAIQTFVTRMPIRAGQTIGLDSANLSKLGAKGAPSAAIIVWSPPLADGATSTGAGPISGAELGFNADVQPLPSVSSLYPSSGSTAGGTSVTIPGQNFSGTTAVSFGGTAAASFTVISDNLIIAVTPAHSAGTVDVTVKNPGQNTTSGADRFTFVAPRAVKCHIPKLKRKTLKAASKMLNKAHCKLGKINGPNGKKARIKKQKPKPGTVLHAGSRVGVTTKRRRH